MPASHLLPWLQRVGGSYKLVRVFRQLIDSVLDASVFWSFDASGYRRHARNFHPQDLNVDLSGRVMLVTGANGGIGLEVARTLARLGAEVRLLCRSVERGQQALEAVSAESAHSTVSLDVVDVSSLASVRAFVDSFEGERVDALIHNAGLIAEERTLTKDGIELTLATHIIGPFLLSRLLEPKLIAAAPGRVIWVSSGGMYTTKLSLADLDWQEREQFDGVAAYAQTKRMQVILAEMLAEAWAGKGIVCQAMHPGWVDTGGLQKSLPNFTRFMDGRLRDAQQGADTVVWLAAADRSLASTGKFWLDRRVSRTHYLPNTREQAEDRQRLWALCEELSGI